MKESKVVLLISIILILMVVIPIIIFYKSRRTIEKRQLEKANNAISNKNQNKIEIVTKEELKENENVIGILEIPKLNLVAPVQEGTSEEVLKIAIGHFPESSFWNGNVALASHNRSQYAHYFERINELKNGDELIYKTKLGMRKYVVYENKEIESADWSVIENSEDNILTLITCIKNISNKRLCVRAKEYKEEVVEDVVEDNINIQNEGLSSEEQYINGKSKVEINNEIETSNKMTESIDEIEENIEEQEIVEEKFELDFSKYDRYYPGLNGGYTCFKKNTEETEKLKKLIETVIQEFGYTNVKIVEDSSINKDRYFTANKINVQNAIYDADGFNIHYYAETEYFLSSKGKETIFQIRSYIQIKGQ